jgi:hypothetical protein
MICLVEVARFMLKRLHFDRHAPPDPERAHQPALLCDRLMAAMRKYGRAKD